MPARLLVPVLTLRLSARAAGRFIAMSKSTGAPHRLETPGGMGGRGCTSPPAPTFLAARVMRSGPALALGTGGVGLVWQQVAALCPSSWTVGRMWAGIPSRGAVPASPLLGRLSLRLPRALHIPVAGILNLAQLSVSPPCVGSSKQRSENLTNENMALRLWREASVTGSIPRKALPSRAASADAGRHCIWVPAPVRKSAVPGGLRRGRGGPSHKHLPVAWPHLRTCRLLQAVPHGCASLCEGQAGRWVLHSGCCSWVSFLGTLLPARCSAPGLRVSLVPVFSLLVP